MKTMVYLKKQEQPASLSPTEQEFLAPIGTQGISVPDLIKALGKPAKTRAERSAFYSQLVSLVERGILETETIQAVAA